MSEDDHGVDVEEDTDLDTASEDHDEERREAERAVRETDALGDVDGGGRESAARERDAEDEANPDAHRDEEPFQSE